MTTVGATSYTSLSEDEEEETQESGLANILSIVGFVAALVVLYFQFDIASSWIKAEDNPRSGEWGQLFE